MIDKVSFDSISKAFEKQFSSIDTNNANSLNSPVSFIDFLYKALEGVDGLQKEADYQNNLFLLGLSANPQDAIVASEKASIALQLTLQIRNKILDAYNEIMRMQV
ncbi:flagellar hook-basal body complex protein FliE [Anaerocellum diazotrophicum]|uniref:Flagellar hook-basal body complex protein FliE n=1 Tax=Caldicellulosiruptor diazotrophicus TaxID=2806205 RepID=A0ABM7NK24_9FIRM|nr:flagellar hook-basal body complex protein FliE [Caldicellulosiruptor diazotrophicus]BCS80458.1 flagellar hook-basal body complex protein FliE [Caldicellulosiruptor diazotrophicus]